MMEPFIVESKTSFFIGSVTSLSVGGSALKENERERKKKSEVKGTLHPKNEDAVMQSCQWRVSSSEKHLWSFRCLLNS